MVFATSVCNCRYRSRLQQHDSEYRTGHHPGAEGDIGVAPTASAQQNHDDDHRVEDERQPGAN